MEFNINDDDIEMWDWRGEDFSLQKDPVLDVPICLWNDMNIIDNSLSCTLGEHTPTRECGDFSYNLDLGDKSNEVLVEPRESSRIKRRRMLQFSSDTNDTSIGNENVSFTSENPKEFENSLLADELLECFDWDPEWNSTFSDDRYNLGNGQLDQSSGEWPANCLNGADMQYSSGETSSCMIDSVPSDEQVELSELAKIPLSLTERIIVRKKPNSSFCRIFKGRKSFMNTPTKLTTTVAYPFTLIKPCGGQGGTTLNDINQRIHASSPPRSEHDRAEHHPHSYPTSAFSGKPVVAKTKIRTEGGKGSITIMRTKG